MRHGCPRCRTGNDENSWKDGLETIHAVKRLLDRSRTHSQLHDAEGAAECDSRRCGKP